MMVGVPFECRAHPTSLTVSTFDHKVTECIMVRVLIVDDQSSFRRQLRALLSYAGLEVVGEAQAIPEAEECVRATHPDLAIVDLMLPGINGLEGISRLTRIAPDLRVILISAYRDHTEMYQTAARQAGAEDFISKDDLDLEAVCAWK